jgi:hypothetical protein
VSKYQSEELGGAWVWAPAVESALKKAFWSQVGGAGGSWPELLGRCWAVMACCRWNESCGPSTSAPGARKGMGLHESGPWVVASGPWLTRGRTLLLLVTASLAGVAVASSRSGSAAA